MADDSVKSEAPAQQQQDNGDNKSLQMTASGNGETAPENQSLSKRQRKKLLKQQKWEEERELRK